MVGIGSLLLMCSYAGLVTYAFYDIMGCDPIKIKVKKILLISSFFSILYY